jgi:putative glutamine amidotransferase
MKPIAVTQRVEFYEKYGECRDAIDQRWIDLLIECGLWPVLIPNNTKFVAALLKNSHISGVILTGGNSLVRYGGDALERDKVEIQLLEYSIQNQLPILGICRGMQLIQDFFGVTLNKINDHVATRFNLEVNPESRLYEELTQLTTTNAYHNLAAFDSVPDLRVSSKSEDGAVMSVEHALYPIYGQMWHSERENPFIQRELKIFRKIFLQISPLET